MCASSWVNAARAGQAVHHAGLLVAVDGAELEQPQRQLAVGAAAGVEDQVVHRAVHRLQVVLLPGSRTLPSASHSASRCIGGYMPSAYQSRCPEISNSVRLGEVRGVDELVAGLLVPLRASSPPSPCG